MFPKDPTKNFKIKETDDPDLVKQIYRYDYVSDSFSFVSLYKLSFKIPFLEINNLFESTILIPLLEAHNSIISKVEIWQEIFYLNLQDYDGITDFGIRNNNLSLIS